MLLRVIIVAAVFILCAVGTSSAQNNVIGVFNDTGGCMCEIVDRDVAGLLSIVVLHISNDGATASQFMARAPQCFQAVYLSDTPAFPVTIGNSQNGVAIGYGACLAGSFQILTINFFAQGLTADCCYYSVVPDPVVPSGQIEIVDCGPNLVVGLGYTDIINSTVACQCAPGPVPCYPVPVEKTTWGKVKTLYQ